MRGWFRNFGSKDGGMFVRLEGIGLDDKPHKRNWGLIATNGDGPNIPSMPSVILIKKLATGELNTVGAVPCVGLFTLKDFKDVHKNFNIKQYIESEGKIKEY